MNVRTDQAADKREYLARIFPYLVEYGLENITIRELCKGTGIVQGTLYYWFGDKTNIVCEATEYGLKTISDRMFEYVFENVDDLRKFFDTCLDEADQYKKELRFVYQMASSPVYGERMRAAGKLFNRTYDIYTDKLSARLNCDENALKPLVYLFISAMLDYVVWDEKEKLRLQLEYIYSVLPKIIKF